MGTKMSWIDFVLVTLPQSLSGHCSSNIASVNGPQYGSPDSSFPVEQFRCLYLSAAHSTLTSGQADHSPHSPQGAKDH